MILIKSYIEQRCEEAGVPFNREAYAGAYAALRNHAMRNRPATRPPAGLKPAGSAGFVFSNLHNQDAAPATPRKAGRPRRVIARRVLILLKGESLRAAAHRLGIPRSTLQRAITRQEERA